MNLGDGIRVARPCMADLNRTEVSLQHAAGE